MSCCFYLLPQAGETDDLRQAVGPKVGYVSGLLAGGGLAAFVDAVVVSRVRFGRSCPATYWLPGAVSLLAFVLISLCTSARDSALQAPSQARVRCFLLAAYVLAFSAIAGSVAILLNGEQQPLNLGVVRPATGLRLLPS